MKKISVREFNALNKFIGTNKNVRLNSTCKSRLRFNIIDKNQVDIAQIKTLSFVNEVNWVGNELQIIVNGDSKKIHEQYSNLFSSKTIMSNENQADKVFIKHTFSVKKGFTSFINGIVVPVIPVIMAAGLLQALYAIFVSVGLLNKVGAADIIKATIISSPKMLISGVFFLICDIGLKFLGFLIGFNTIRHLGGKNINITMAVIVPLIVSAPHLFLGNGIGGSADGNGYQWVLYSFGKVNGISMGIYIMGYASMFLPQLGAGVFYVYMDRWVKTWMSPLFDSIFRNFIVLLATGLFTFFIIGPSLGIVERSLYLLFSYIQQVPFGIGNGIFGFAWVFIVVSGLHGGITLAIISDGITNPAGSQLFAFTSISSMSTIATCLAVAIRAKEANMKNLAVGSLFSAVFGTSEPTYYGISVVRPILFLPVAIARGLTGMLIGILDIRAYQAGGKGILGFTAALTNREGVDTTQNLIKMVGAMVFLFSTCLAMTLFIYKERKTDKKMINNLYHKLFKTLKVKSDLELFNEQKIVLAELKKTVSSKEFKAENKKIEKEIAKENSFKYQVLKRQDLQIKLQKNLDKKVAKLKSKLDKIDFKIQRLMQKNKSQAKAKVEGLITTQEGVKNKIFASQLKVTNRVEKLDKEIATWTAKAESQKKQVAGLLEKIEQQHVMIETKIKKSFAPSLVDKPKEEREKTNAMIFNFVHNLEINYKIIDKREV